MSKRYVSYSFVSIEQFVLPARTETRSCRTRKRALHVHSPGVAARAALVGSVLWPAAAAATTATVELLLL